MNAKIDSIEEATRIRPGGLLRTMGGPAAYEAFVPGIRAQRGPPPAGARRRVGTGLAVGRAGELWETLSYVVIWLSGLAAIALCFL